jgi:TATA-box binding protein (TBP) (component of TFIID and TFIIIB)
MKPLGKEVKAIIASAKTEVTLTVEKLRELADHLEKNPQDFEGFQYGVDPPVDEPRFQAFTVRWRLAKKKVKRR